jgi:HEAT repeat protein
MKKIIYSFLLGCITLSLNAQTDQRTLSTKVTDILARYPYHNAEENAEFAEQIAKLNKEGLSELVGRLSAPGKGDNTATEFAIMAYTFYITGEGKQHLINDAVEVYGSHLNNKELGDTRSFLILQLEILGSKNAFPYLTGLVQEENVGEKAIRTIGRLNTEEANKFLLNSLKKLQGRNLQAAVEMLGFNGYQPAVKSLNKLVSSADENTSRLAILALSQIGDPASAKTMAKQVNRAGYGYSKNGASGAFADYILKLAENGNQSAALKLANDYLKAAESAGNVPAKITGLTILKEINPSSALPLIMKAATDEKVEYRAAALALSKDFRTNATNRQWLGILAKAPDYAKEDILYYLADTRDQALGEDLKQYLHSSDISIKLAAIHAVGQTAGKSALKELLPLLNGNPDEAEAVKRELLQMKGSDILENARSYFLSAGSGAKIALLDVFARKRDHNAASLVFSELQSAQPDVRKAAYAALPSVVEENDLDRLFNLAPRTQGEELKAVQQAMVAAVRNADKTKAAHALKTQMQQNNPSIYFPVLTALDNRESITVLRNAFDGADVETQKAVLAALGNSTNKAASDALLNILRTHPSTALKEDIANALLRIAGASNAIPSDQKILILREVMAIASGNQKKAVIREAGRARGFSAFVFAAEFLDDPELGADAGAAVMNIALADKNLNGEMVRKALTKAMNSLKGMDSEYQKQAILKHLEEMPAGEGFVPLFNGKDLSGWKGLVGNPISRRKMSAEELAAAQKKADSLMFTGWKVEDGLLIFTGKGDNIATVKEYGDFEMWVDWKITKDGDAGIYLRGTPQVQIWDTARVNVGAQVGSGGLYNNQKNPSAPLVLADNAVGEWNTFRIIMKGDKVTVYLNGVLVVDNVTLENFWDRSQPIFPREQIELQAHGTYVAYRNIFIKSLDEDGKQELTEEEKSEGFIALFNGTNLDQWQGNKESYVVDGGTILVQPGKGSGGNLYTKKEYSDFIIRFEFQLTPGANNGLGIRAPLEGDAAYEGMEIQILDNDAPVYKDLKDYQYHGSVYGVIPAKRGYLKPVGEWNYEEVYVKGSRIRVTLNGTVILDGDIHEASKNGTLDHRPHPGLSRTKGYIGFLGHGSVLRIRNVRIKEI